MGKPAALILAVIVLFMVVAGSWFFFLRSKNVEKVSRAGPIIFFGDSLTAGIGAGESEDFPSVIAKDLNLTNVINAGVPGDTTATALQRLQQDVLNKKPSIVLVELSGNDFLGQQPTEDTINTLDEIVKRIKEGGAAVVLVHIRFPYNGASYDTGFKNIANKYKAKLVWNSLDGIIDNPSLMSDTIHPNAAGYKILAERIEKVLKELI